VGNLISYLFINVAGAFIYGCERLLLLSSGCVASLPAASKRFSSFESQQGFSLLLFIFLERLGSPFKP
jgi:hypothetical protein